MTGERAARAVGRRHGGRGERGSMAVEVVLFAPVLVAFVILVTALGRYVSVRGDVEAAARDAARAGSVQRSYGEAQTAAQRTVSTGVGRLADCDVVDLSESTFAPGGDVTANLACRVDFSGLGLIGLSGSITVDGQGVSPIDVYRRTG